MLTALRHLPLVVINLPPFIPNILKILTETTRNNGMSQTIENLLSGPKMVVEVGMVEFDIPNYLSPGSPEK